MTAMFWVLSFSALFIIVLTTAVTVYSFIQVRSLVRHARTYHETLSRLHTVYDREIDRLILSTREFLDSRQKGFDEVVAKMDQIVTAVTNIGNRVELQDRRISLIERRLDHYEMAVSEETCEDGGD